MSDLFCPECGSKEVWVTAKTMFMVNTGDHYCHAVKTHDSDAECGCLVDHCRWEGFRKDLAVVSRVEK